MSVPKRDKALLQAAGAWGHRVPGARPARPGSAWADPTQSARPARPKARACARRHRPTHRRRPRAARPQHARRPRPKSRLSRTAIWARASLSLAPPSPPHSHPVETSLPNKGDTRHARERGWGNERGVPREAGLRGAGKGHTPCEENGETRGARRQARPAAPYRTSTSAATMATLSPTSSMTRERSPSMSISM